MPVGAVIGAAGSIAGGIAGGKGAKKAAKIQAQTAQQQMNLQKQLYNQTLSNFNPEITSGNSAQTSIDQLLGLSPSSQSATSILRSTPGYQFRMDEALKGVDAGAAARGLYRSGAAMKALQDRAYDVADQGFNTYLAQLTDVANRGAGAKSSVAGAAQNYGNASASIAASSADAQSNAALANARNLQNTFGGISYALGQAFPSSYGTSTVSTSNNPFTGYDFSNMPDYNLGGSTGGTYYGAFAPGAFG